MMTKSQTMELTKMGLSRECFDHDTWGQFDVTAMRARAKELGTLEVVPLHLILDHIKRHRVTEHARVMDLKDHEWKDDPGIIIFATENGVLWHATIDGHHRALRREHEGKDTMLFWMIPIEKALRPAEGWGTVPGLEWGDPIVDGKIVKKVQP